MRNCQKKNCKRAPWYDQVTNITLVFFADGLEPDAIAERTGFDLYEVERILTPEKPIRFNGPAERGLLSPGQQALYAALVDLGIARNMAFFCSKFGAQGLATRAGMAHTLPILNAMERQWRARQARATRAAGMADTSPILYAMEANHRARRARAAGIMEDSKAELPDEAWHHCVYTDFRLAIGLDRGLAGYDLPALLALAA